MKIRFIGDIHGKILDYLQIIDGVENSVQVGDFGMGFGTKGAADFVDSMIDEMPGNHRYIRGNHDDPKESKKSKHWIKDGTIENDIMYVGGANSIDKDYRIEGLSWWPNEQLNTAEWNSVYDKYINANPRIMVTHDCPKFIYYEIHDKVFDYPGDVTAISFDLFWKDHKPEIWIFGHHHKSFDKVIDGTRFICLAELECIDLEV